MRRKQENLGYLLNEGNFHDHHHQDFHDHHDLSYDHHCFHDLNFILKLLKFFNFQPKDL